MSKLTQYADRSMSIGADLGVGALAGLGLYAVIALVKPVLPFGDALQSVVPALGAAAVYMRNRQNLNDPAPAGYVKP